MARTNSTTAPAASRGNSSPSAEERALIDEAKKLAAKFDADPDEVIELVRLGFVEIDRAIHHRLILATNGKEKCGKTHFAIHTAPDPIALIDFDIGTEGMLQNGDKSRRILHRQFNIRKQAALAGDKVPQDRLEEEWRNASDAIRAAIRSPLIRTLIIDTSTELWELARLAEFGRLEQVPQFKYVKLNGEFRSLVQSVYVRPDLNVVFIEKVKKEYKDDKWRGDFERSGFGDLPFLVQENIRHFRTKPEDDEDEPQFALEIVDSRHNSEMNGEILTGPQCTFTYLGRCLFPGSKKEDWQ